MSYRRSRARREFESQIDVCVKELGLALPLIKAEVDSSRFIAVYYVFIFSQLEVYIRDLIEDAIGLLNEVKPELSRWPDLMLAYLLHSGHDFSNEYRRFILFEDEGALLHKIATSARAVAGWSSGTTPIMPAEPDNFLSKKKYPSPNNLPQLFRRVGIDRVWAMIGREGRINGELTLKSLNDIRTNIVHEGKVPPGFSVGDFKARVKQMKLFVTAIDKGVANHFCTDLFDRQTWNRAMRD